MIIYRKSNMKISLIDNVLMYLKITVLEGIATSIKKRERWVKCSDYRNHRIR